MQAEQTSFLFGANAPFIEELYARFLDDPSRVDADWRTFFEALAEERGDVLAEVRGASWAPNGARGISVSGTSMTRAPLGAQDAPRTSASTSPRSSANASKKMRQSASTRLGSSRKRA